MLGFFLDPDLQVAVTPNRPKRVLLPEAGGARTTVLYIGDPYQATVSVTALSGATSLVLDQSFEFLPSGQVVIGTLTVSYTSKSTDNRTLLGVSGVTRNIAVGETAIPHKIWRSNRNLLVFPIGLDLEQGVSIALKVSDAPLYGFPNTPLIYPQLSISMGAAQAVEVDCEIRVAPGAPREFVNWQLQTSALVDTTTGVATDVPRGTAGTAAVAPFYVSRRDQFLPQNLRLLPVTREVSDTGIGFTVGAYRWRDQDTENAQALVPTQWDMDLSTLGPSAFVDGIAGDDDLAPQGLVQQEDSIYLTIHEGTYFDGPVRYFLPGAQMLEFRNATFLSHTLTRTPQWPKPVFVGTWQRDSNGFYTIATEYRYQAGAFDGDDPQFRLDRTTNTVTLNQVLLSTPQLLGVLSGTGTDYFDFPVYPVREVVRVYVDHGAGLGQSDCLAFTFSEEDGTLVITGAPGNKGEPVYALVTPGIAILYATEDGDTRQLPVDLNPAFSGITAGYVYLQHRRQTPSSVTLSCDKPLIPIPATFSSVIGMLAYGPVYQSNDYALLTATAFGSLGNEVIPHAKLQVLVDPVTFTGLINYKDPVAAPLILETGADGVANMVFTPSPEYGFYFPLTPVNGVGLATTTLSNDSLVLPADIPLSQLWNPTDKWMSVLYLINDTSPAYGKTGADVTRGEVPFLTSGTPGTTSYKTNGVPTLWGTSTAPVVPITALDAQGHAYDSQLFSGMVHALVFATSIPQTISGASGYQSGSFASGPGSVGAYFLTFLQRAAIQVQVVGSDVISNSVLLQMALSPILLTPWLILDSATQGLLNQFRLGYTPVPTGPAH